MSNFLLLLLQVFLQFNIAIYCLLFTVLTKNKNNLCEKGWRECENWVFILGWIVCIFGFKQPGLLKLEVSSWKERFTNQYVEMIIEYSGFLNPYDMTFLYLGIWLRHLSNKSNWWLNFKKDLDFLTFPSIPFGHVKYKFI